MSHPPHLPEKSCSVSLRNLWCSIRNFIFFILVSLLAGITGALIVSAWIEPTFNIDYTMQTPKPEDVKAYYSVRTPDAGIVRRLEQSTVALYDSRLKIGDGFFTKDAHVGDIVMLSSDGWGVLFDTHFTKNDATHWDAIDYVGNAYTIEKTLFDAGEGMVFVKLEGREFRVMSYAPADFVYTDVGKDVWVLSDSTWYQDFIGGQEVVVDSPYPASHTYSRARIEPQQHTSGIILSEQGQLVGFVGNEGFIYTTFSLMNHISSVLSSGALKQSTHDWVGYMVSFKGENRPDDIPSKGFYITRGTTPGLQVGDIVFAIDNKSFDAENLPFRMAQLVSGSSISVWRSGKKIDIMIES